MNAVGVRITRRVFDRSNAVARDPDMPLTRISMRTSPLWVVKGTPMDNADKVAWEAVQAASGSVLGHAATCAGGPLAGHAVRAGYAIAPEPVKAGAAVGLAVAAHGAVHVLSVSTAAAAAATAASLFVPFVAIGAAIGFAAWLRSK